MKLLYITNGITGSGGLERVLSVKASMLADEFGYDVHIISLNEEGKEAFFEFSLRVIKHSISVGGNPFSYLRSYVTGIRKKIAAIEPDIISVCDDGLKGFFIPLIIGRKVPVIYERHVSKLIETGSESTLLSRISVKLKYVVMNRLAKMFDRFVVLTAGNTCEWNLDNIEVIPNPLPFYPVHRSSLLEKKVIAVGKQSYQKAYDLLLHSWSLLPSGLSDWKLHIYGTIDENQKLDDLSKNLGISTQVIFHPPEKNIEEQFCNSSIFVLSSRFEGFGMVIIEAMACGLPVVSFDCPYGPADIISHGSDGFLTDNGDTKQLASNLAALMIDSELRMRLGAAARINALQYRPEIIIIKWDQLFRTLLKGCS